MKVYLPFKRPKNSFLDELEKVFKGEFIFDSLFNAYNYEFDVLHIHWPEAITEGSVPDVELMRAIKSVFLEFKKKHIPIIYNVHNVRPHRDTEFKFKPFYELIESFADTFLHYGTESMIQFQNKYPDKKHLILNHPLYTDIPNSISKASAREILKISAKDKVILVFGDIRTIAEESFILNVFKNIRTEEKFLLTSRWKNLKILSKPRYIQSIYFRWQRILIKLKKDRKLNNEFVDPEDIQLYFNAADIVFIPRIENLNSGVAYLALTFGKTIIGPDTGNIKEILNIFSFPLYRAGNPKDAAIKINQFFHDGFNKPIDESKLANYLPENIVEVYLSILKEAVSKEN